MASSETYLAIDLGAGSGRVMKGRFDGERIELEEVRRFDNLGVRTLHSLHWDVLRLFDEMKAGIRQAAGDKPRSVGVDTWGVDYALLDRDGELVGNPYHYRDGRTNGVMPRAFETVSRREIFEHTGLQFMELNTLYQLLSMKGSAQLDAAASLLMMPDLFHYWLTGEKSCEFTDASTTQFYNPRERRWATELFEKFGLPAEILGPVVEPATRLGPLLRGVAEEVGVERMTVVAPAAHDTGSAVAAAPAEGADWAFLSSGTWSLLGAETERPYVTPTALDKNFTNEGGVAGTTRLLKNICGLWLLEECRRQWALEGDRMPYDQLIAEAEQAAPFRSLIDVDDPSFVAPGDMPARIRGFCERSGQPAPREPGEIARTIFESLALKYRQVMRDLAEIVGKPMKTLHIVGGGSRNEMLSQYAADACAVPAIAGPVEATALGNVLAQAIAMGRIADFGQAREVVRRSFEPTRYEPRPGGGWDEAAERLDALNAGQG